MASDDPVTGRCGQAAATGRYGQGELRGGGGIVPSQPPDGRGVGKTSGKMLPQSPK